MQFIIWSERSKSGRVRKESDEIWFAQPFVFSGLCSCAAVATESEHPGRNSEPPLPSLSLCAQRRQWNTKHTQTAPFTSFDMSGFLVQTRDKIKRRQWTSMTFDLFADLTFCRFPCEWLNKKALLKNKAISLGRRLKAPRLSYIPSLMTKRRT